MRSSAGATHLHRYVGQEEIGEVESEQGRRNTTSHQEHQRHNRIEDDLVPMNNVDIANEVEHRESSVNRNRRRRTVQTRLRVVNGVVLFGDGIINEA